MPPDVDPADLVSRDPGPDWHYECGYSASCFPGDDQGAFEEEEVEEYEDRVGAFGRLPDFYQFELSATLAPLGKYSSGVGVAVIDREGQFFVGAGAGASFPAGAPVSGSFQLGWINQDATPNAAQLREFLRGFGFSLVLGYWGGGGVQINLGDGSSATMLGLVPPGVDASVTYSGKVP
jgi:hypothetical protein